MATGTWGIQTSKKMFRAMIAAVFAIALVLAISAPVAAQELDESADGLFTGTYIGIITENQEVHAEVGGVGDQEPGEYAFFYLDDDEFIVILSPDGPELLVDMEDWECAVEATLEQDADHVAVIGYQSDETSTFNIATEADLTDCPGIEDDDDVDEEDDEHAEPVAQPTRVDTGAGGTAGGGAGVLALLLGLITVAGATVLRKGSAIS
jgi:hypothetical protein